MKRRVLAGLLRTALRAAETTHTDPAHLTQAAGLDASAINAMNDGDLEEDTMMAAMQALVQAIGLEAVPLAMARAIRPEYFGAPGFAMQAAPNLREAAMRLARYHRLAADDLKIIATHGADGGLDIEIIRDLPDPTINKLATQAVPAGITQIARILTQTHASPLRVTLPFEPWSREAYEHFLTCPVDIDPRSGARVAFSADTTAYPIEGANEALLTYMDQRSEQLLSALPALETAPTVASRTRAMLREMLGGETPTADSVSKRLGMSRRTLYRRLREEDTTFQDVLDALRAQIAQAMLLDDGQDIAEVAFVLGFSEPRAFYRAFKRWTGTTPARWRVTASPA